MNASDLDPSELLELHQLAARAARKAGANADAADIAQDTITKLEGRDLDEIPNLKAWVQLVATNGARDLHRRAERKKKYDDAEPQPEPQSFSTKLVAQQKVRDLVDGLPDKYQSVVRLTYYDALSAVEVGERLGYSTATVHKMLSDARSMLRPNVTAPPGYKR